MLKTRPTSRAAEQRAKRVSPAGITRGEGGHRGSQSCQSECAGKVAAANLPITPVRKSRPSSQRRACVHHSGAVASGG